MTGYPVVMEIADSARKHGISDEDMTHAVRQAVGEFPQEHADRIGLVGPDRAGRLLEVVVLGPDGDEPTLIHADVCRRKFLRYLP